MKNNLSASIFIMLVIFISACSQPVLRQDVPVTTNPLGAKIYANGQLMGTTPASVALERNRDHILTLILDNYRQENVVISRQYQKEKVYLKAIQSGVNSGLFFKDPRMGIGSSMSSLSTQESTGEAYILVPPAVKVELTPVAGAPATQATTADKAVKQAPAVALEKNEPALDKEEMAKGLVKIGAAAALSQTKPLEKKTEISSSSRSYVQSDGTRVTEKSGASVGLSVNPAGLINVLDTLFK